MIYLHAGLPDLALAQSLAELQARAYASTGMRGWSAKEITSLLSNESNRLYIVAEDKTKNATPSGFLLIAFVADEVEILSLAVDPKSFRTGLASRLMEMLVNDCLRAKKKYIILEVAETNLPALSLYKSLAFTEAGRRPGYYMLEGVRVSALILRKHIATDL